MSVATGISPDVLLDAGDEKPRRRWWQWKPADRASRGIDPVMLESLFAEAAARAEWEVKLHGG